MNCFSFCKIRRATIHKFLSPHTPIHRVTRTFFLWTVTSRSDFAPPPRIHIVTLFSSFDQISSNVLPTRLRRSVDYLNFLMTRNTPENGLLRAC